MVRVVVIGLDGVTRGLMRRWAKKKNYQHSKNKGAHACISDLTLNPSFKIM